VVLELTQRGTRLIRDSVAALDGLDRSFRGILGDTRFEHLQRVARVLYRALHLEDEVFEGHTGLRAAPSVASRGRAGNGTRDIQRLATRLRRQLGSRDAARLAELLEPTTSRAAT
jgi:hypothetical protein